MTFREFLEKHFWQNTHANDKYITFNLGEYSITVETESTDNTVEANIKHLDKILKSISRSLRTKEIGLFTVLKIEDDKIYISANDMLHCELGMILEDDSRIRVKNYEYNFIKLYNKPTYKVGDTVWIKGDRL